MGGGYNHNFGYKGGSSNYMSEVSEFYPGTMNSSGTFNGVSASNSDNGTYSRKGGLKSVTPPQYSYTNHAHVGGGGLVYSGSSSNSKFPNQDVNFKAGSEKSGEKVPATEDNEEYERGHWGSKAEFILSCIGFSVGIGNVWRFPYLAYSNGGGAFLVPYIILLVFVGKPMYYMETAMGQFSRTSPLQIWECAPIAKGVGFGMLIVSLTVSIYYNVIMCYSIVYMGASFTGINNPLPWTTCGNSWNNDKCTNIESESLGNLSNTLESGTIDIKTVLSLPRCRPSQGIVENCTYNETPATQYWEKFVLNITDSLGDPGDLGGYNYFLPLSLLFSWFVVFLCLMKGVKSSGKVVYFTATFPYAILIALLVQGLLLDGATDGLYYLFVPSWEKLLHFGVWRDAASQMFFSLGLSWGGLIMFGSYNKFHNKINIDAGVVSSLDFITSLIASCVIFSVLGHQSKILGVDIEHVADKGQGLAFVTYPAALQQLPMNWLWAVLFFAMLFFLGLDSEFALLETALTALYDGYPKLRNHKVKITFMACVFSFLLGLPCVSNSGQYVLDLMDTYAAGFAVIWVAIWELIGFMWIYGVKNISRDIKLMIGSEPSWFWKICWVCVSPLFLIIIFVTAIATWEEHKYGGVISYPDWAHVVGWILVSMSAIQIPLWALIYTVYYAAKGRISQVVKPTRKWGPGDPEVRRQILDEQNGINRSANIGGKYAYDNQAMVGYEAYHM